MAKKIKMTVVDKLWNHNCRPVPENGYDISELKWLLGKDVFFKKDFKKAVKRLMKDLFKDIEHGDQEHRDWLEKKLKDFIK